MSKPPPQKHIFERLAKQSVDIRVPSVKEEIVKVFQPWPKEHIHKRVAEESEDIPVPPIKEENVEVLRPLYLWSASRNNSRSRT